MKNFLKLCGWKFLHLLSSAMCWIALICLVLSFPIGAPLGIKIGIVVIGIGCAYCTNLSSSHIPQKIKPNVSEMSGLDFESYCAMVLAKKGFTHIMVTPASGDFGADLIAQDKKGLRWVFQCKRYSGRVGNSAIQEVVAAKAHYQADRAGVMTNSRLTEKAKQLAWENEVLFYECVD